MTVLRCLRNASAGLAVLASVIGAQTAYYNTDRGRPVQVEDAYTTERYAFELKLAPVRMERGRGGLYHWGIEPEIAYGVLPRTQIEVGLPIAFVDKVGGSTRRGVAGLEISAMHNLNTETRSVPALGIRADILAPVGALAFSEPYASLTGIVTRTFRWARFHINGQYTFGEQPESGSQGAGELSRWLGGIAIDKTYPLRATLVTLETFAQRPIEDDGDVFYTSTAGVRYQLSPTFAIDGGVGRRWKETNPAWFATFGAAYSFGISSLIPVSR